MNATPPQTPTVPAGRLRLLIVEDVEADAQLCLHELNRAGFEVSADLVATPEAFAAKLQSDAYDLVLADYRLPHWTGMDALRLLQQLGKDIPCILVTGTLGDEAAVECIKRGATDCVLKDRLARLPAAVRRALEEKSLREERDRALLKLREKEASFRLLFANNPLPMWVIDLETPRFLEVNDPAIAAYGYSRDEFLRMRIHDIWRQEDVPHLLEELARERPLLQLSGSWRHRLRDGRIIDVEIASHGLEFGARKAVLCVIQDVTLRKRQESALQRLTDRLRLLHQIDLEILAASMTPAEIAGVVLHRIASLMPGDHSHLVLFPAHGDQAVFAAVWEKTPMGPPAGTTMNRNHFGPMHMLREERYYEDVAAFPQGSSLLDQLRANGVRSLLRMPIILEERLIGSLCFASMRPSAFDPEHMNIAREVATQLNVAIHNARAREALRSSEANFCSLVANSPLGIYRSSVEGRFLAVNPALVKMLGYASEAELLALDITQDTYADPQERTEMMELSAATHEFRGVQVQLKRKDGSRITVRLTGRPLFTPEGQVEAFEGIVEDVTQQQLLEEQLRQAQKMEAVGQMASGIAHDFNNMLGVILGYTEILLARQHPDDAVPLQLEEIKNAARRAAEITRQLLAFSRQQVLDVRVLDLNAALAAIENMLKPLIRDDIELSMKLALDLGRVKADPGQVVQILMNLVVNARDAMPRGGRLTIETANTDLDENYASQHFSAIPGAYVMLAVSDTGVGMDAHTQARIFEPFFTTKEIGKGTGLGLASVYGIIKQSSGHVWVYSEPGKGTTFKILLPRVQEAAQTLESPAIDERALRGTETILLVEDEPALRRLTRRLLEECGYTLLEAANPAEAAAISSNYASTIHLLLTDVVMPGMSGTDLADAIAPHRPGIKVLYISGYGDQAVVHNNLLKGGRFFLQKPFSKAALAGKVRGILDTSAY